MEDRFNPNSEVAVAYELSLLGFKNIVQNNKEHLHENSKRDQVASKDIYYDKGNGEKGTISVKGTSLISCNGKNISMSGMLRCKRRDKSGNILKGYSDDFEKALLGFIDYWAFSCKKASDVILGFFLITRSHLKNYLKFKVDEYIYEIEDPHEWVEAIKAWAKIVEDKIWEEFSRKRNLLKNGDIFYVNLDPNKYASVGGSISYTCKVLTNEDETFSPFVLIPLNSEKGSFRGTWHYYSKEAIALLDK